MPVTKEFTINLEDRPGTLGKFSRALAEKGVNILGFQSFPSDKKQSVVRMVVDNPTTAKTVLDSQKVTYTETQVAQVHLPHRPGELSRAASKLGEQNININYAYTAVDPATNTPLLIFGVENVSQAASILDETAAAAA